MSRLIALAALAVATLFAADAGAEGTGVAVVAGYGTELRRWSRPGATSYGWGLGARVEHRLDSGLYVGAGVTFHLGSDERAADPAGVSTYQSIHHASYLAPEIGWELTATRVLLRPYVAAGGWLGIDRVLVRGREMRDDGVSPLVMPGLIVAYGTPEWHGGLDFRLPIVTALPILEAAPTFLFEVGMGL